MIPIPLQEAPNPPLRATRAKTISQLDGQRFELVVVGNSPLGRELVRLASHNSISTVYLSSGDFIEGSFTRVPISEILSARYDGAIDLNHIEILALNHFRDGEVQLVGRCGISKETFKFTCGALVNETGGRIGIASQSNGRNKLPVARSFNARWFNAVVEEQSAVFKFQPGKLRALSNPRAAEFILSSILKAGGDAREVAPLVGMPLIDSTLTNSAGVQSTIKEFIVEANSKGVSDQQIAQAIDRFGTRAAHMVRLSNWFEPIHPLILRGEFELSIATEHPCNLEELLQRRLGFENAQKAADQALVDLAELFQKLQHS